MTDPYALIDDLAHCAQPVSRLAPPMRRALGWIVAALVAGFAATRLMPVLVTDWRAPFAGMAMAAAMLSLLLGALLVAGAFTVSIAGRQFRLAVWLGPLLAAWVVLSGVYILSSTTTIGKLGDGRYCFLFIVTAGLPMAGVMMLALRRSKSPWPARTGFLAGSGVAFLSLALLGLCHASRLTMVDFVMHIAGTLVVVAFTTAFSRYWLKI